MFFAWARSGAESAEPRRLSGYILQIYVGYGHIPPEYEEPGGILCVCLCVRLRLLAVMR